MHLLAGIVAFLILAFAFTVASKDQRKLLRGIVVGAGAAVGLVIGFNALFGGHLRSAVSFDDFCRRMDANFEFELAKTESILWILGPVAVCMVFSWFALNIYGVIFPPRVSSTDPAQSQKPPAD